MRLRRSGFTLIEVLLVIALLALISTAIVAGTNAIDRLQREGADAESAALSAISAARRTAVTTARTVTLVHQTEEHQLTWEGGAVPLPDNDETVALLPPVMESAYLVGGRLQENAITRIRFYPDGTCDAFRLQIRRQNQSRESVIDPWTSSPVNLAEK